MPCLGVPKRAPTLCTDTLRAVDSLLQGNTTNECAYAGEDSREAHRGGRYIAVGATVPAPALYVS
jgi:hypothetical protein